MPIGSGIVYNTGDLILSQVSSSGTAFLETKIASATSSLIYFDSTARINSASLNSITVGTASYVSGSTSIITNLTASNISASGTGSFGIVGIGTVNPAYKLDVNGNANFTNGFYTNTDASSTSYFVGANGTRPIIFQNNTAASYDFGFKFSDSNTFTIVGGNTLANPTTDLVSFTYDGKVGIGTTVPSALLHIYTGSIGSTAYPLLIDNSSGGAGVNVVGFGFANGGIMKHSITTAIYGNDYMAFNVGQGASYNQERMRINSDGNVGIGTTLPVAKLQVAGNISGSSFTSSVSNAVGFLGTSSWAQNVVSASYALTSSVATNETLGTVTGRGASTSTQITVATATGGSMYTGRKAGSSYGDGVSGATFKSITDNSQSFATSYAFAAYYSGSNGINSFYVSSAGDGYFSGSVGIGTTSPGEKLTVSGNSYIIGNTGAVGTGLAYYLGDSSNRDISLTRVGTAALAIGRYYPSAWAETIRFTADGNVGIGSSSPSSKFEVLTSTVSLANQPNIIGNFRGDTDGRSLIRVDNTSTSAGAAALQSGISFVAYSNVSNQPSTNKHEAQIILGSTGATSVTGGQTGTLQIIAPQDIAFNVSASNVIMTGSSYTTFGTNAMYITRTGNVGIGTTSPSAKLQVGGNISGSSFTSSISNAVGFFGTSSWALNALTASSVLTASSLVTTNNYTINNLTASGAIRAAQIAEKIVTFTPLTGSITGAPAWYRIISGSGVADYGRVRMSTTFDNSRSDIEFMYGVRNYDTDGAGAFINITRASTYNSVFNAVRVIETGNLAEPYAIDVLIGNYVGLGSPSAITCLYESQFISAVLDTPTFVSASATGSNIVKTVYTTYTSGYPRIGPTYSDGLAVANSQGQLSVGYRGNYAYNVPSGLNYALLVSGSVGIGTDNPSAKLHVIDSTSEQLRIQSSGTPTRVRFVNNAGTTYYNYIGSETLGVNNVGLILQTGNGSATTRMVVDVNGSVGIGTTLPDSRLHVYSTSWEPAIRLTSTSGSVKTYGLVNNPYWATGSFHIYDYTTDNSRIHISSTGNIGLAVGSTTPANRLDVVGDLRVRAAGAAMILDTATTSDGRMEYKYNGTRKALIGVDSDNLQIAADSGNYLQFRTNSTQRMIINNSGGVGIGTSNPYYLFDLYDTGANSAMMSLRSSGSGNARIYLDAANGDLTGGDYCYLGQDNSSLDFIINTGGSAGNIHLQPKEGTNNGILYVSGSTRFGRVISQTHEFTGSINLSGSLNATASWANNVVSASFATTAQTANALNASNTYTIAGLTSAYVDVNGSSAPTTGIYRPSTKTLGLSADGTLIFKISNVSAPATSSIETGNFLVQSGNVGIGTTNATDKLTVYGALASYKDGANTIQTQVYLANAGNTRAFNIQLNSGGTGLDLWSYNSANAWLRHTTFDYDGRVGIGTAAPVAKFEISGSSNSALMNIKSPISGAILYVSGSGAVGIGTSNVGAYTLQVNGSFGATTKSFVIDHPTKEGKKLIYGSLESPYHGIRLTGRDTLKEGKCKIQLPDYIYKLILHDSVNIQLTGIKCNKTLYVDDINVPENYFTIAYDKAIFETYKDYDFFWDFTAIRADVPELITEL
jgi:hypothetical protein